MSSLSAWFIGSHPQIPATTVTVTANSVTTGLTFPAGGYYVDDNSSVRSAARTLAQVIQTHSQIASCTGGVCEDRRVRVTANVNFTASFSDGMLPALLGISAAWSTPAMVQAAGLSPFLWCPGKMDMQDGRYGTQGPRVYDTAYTQAATGRVVATGHHYQPTNKFDVRFAENGRIWPLDEGAGSYVAFVRACARLMYKWNVYSGLVNDEGSATLLDLTAVPRQGPYVMRSPRGDFREQYERGIDQVHDYLDHASLDAVGAVDY